jgi:hypothetical protein
MALFASVRLLLIAIRNDADFCIPTGLVSDDSRARADRISIWRDFNNAWLALLQRQKDMVESHQQLGQSQSLLSLEGLRNMGKTVIDMCDVLEKHGLVDYEMGMWEERIVDSKSEGNHSDGWSS